MGSQTLKISNVEGKDQEEQVENGDPEKTNLMKEREYNLKYKRATSKVLGKIRYCIWNKNRVHSQGSITWTWMIVSGEFIISFVLSPQQKFEVTDGPVSWFSFIGKQRKIHPPGVRTCRPKRREEKPPAQFWLLFLCFFLLPVSLPSVNWLSRRAVILPEVLTPVLRPSFVLFLWAFPSLSFSHRHSGLLFPILTT